MTKTQPQPGPKPTEAVSRWPDLFRQVAAILGEVTATPGEPHERKAALMHQVAERIGADRWIWLVTRFTDDGVMMSLSFMQHGHSEREVALLMESAAETNPPLIEHKPMIELLRQQTHITRRRHELVPDEAWYESTSYRLYRKPMGLNEFVYSLRKLPNSLFSGVGFHRNDGRAAFTEDQAALVHALFASADALHTMDLPDTNGADIMDLPPRVRTTFGLLLEGFSRKQIAEHLGVSPNTVAEYSSRVYKHFRVRGQRELMGRFRNGDMRTNAKS